MRFPFVWLSFALALAPLSHALPPSTARQLQHRLELSPPAELPALVTSLLTKAPPSDLEATMKLALEYVAARQPGALVPVVTSAAAAMPQTADKLASVASNYAPKYSAQIAAAANNAAHNSSKPSNEQFRKPDDNGQGNGDDPDHGRGRGNGHDKDDGHGHNKDGDHDHDRDREHDYGSP